MLITTTYKGATDNVGSRITARANGKQKTISYPHQFSGTDCHMYAAMMLLGAPYKMEIAYSTERGYKFKFNNQ